MHDEKAVVNSLAQDRIDKMSFMNAKKLILVILSFSILLSLNSWATTKKITRLGRYSFARVSSDVPALDVMKLLAERYAADIKSGFEQAGYSALAEPFLEKIRSADFTEKFVPVGAAIVWMLFRDRGRVMVWKDLEWAGKAPVDVFSITIVQGDKEYEFIIPKPCGNIALYMVTQKNTFRLLRIARPFLARGMATGNWSDKQN
jgi:hypothetical protein